MNKKLVGLFSTVVTAGFLLSGAAFAQDAVTLRLGFPEGMDNPIGVMASEFKEAVEEKTEGAVTVELYPSSQLGSIREQLEAVQMGNQEMMICTPAWVSAFVPQYSVLSFPYLFQTREEAHELLDGEVGDILIDIAGEAGFKVLGFPEVGFREVTNSVRPITKLEDFEGIKIRLMGDPVHIATLQALGANPVSMDFSELYSALQQNVVDAQENSPTNIYLNKFYEVQDYLSYTNLFYDAWVVSMNPDVWDSLEDDTQAIIQEALDEAIKNQRVNVAAADEENKTLLEDVIAVNEISDEEMDRIVEVATTVYTEFNDTLGEDLVNQVLSAVGK